MNQFMVYSQTLSSFLSVQINRAWAAQSLVTFCVDQLCFQRRKCKQTLIGVHRPIATHIYYTLTKSQCFTNCFTLTIVSACTKKVLVEEHAISSHIALVKISYLVAAHAILLSERFCIFQPAHFGLGVSCCRAPKLHGVGRRDGVQLLLHLIRWGPIWRPCRQEETITTNLLHHPNIKNHACSALYIFFDVSI